MPSRRLGGVGLRDERAYGRTSIRRLPHSANRGGNGGQARWISLPGDARENDVFRMDWVDERHVGIGQLNRRQNHVTVYVTDVENGSVKPVFEDRTRPGSTFPRPGEPPAPERASSESKGGRRSCG